MASKEYYTALRVARSDGQAYDVAQNEASSHLREEDRTQPVDQDGDQPSRWKASIGAHLKYQLGGPKDRAARDDAQYILRDFPAGYEMRVQPKKDKVHAYLYGHPKDIKTRYRTPADFVPHLLWLISASDDRNDCSCQFCLDMCARAAPEEPKPSRVAFASPTKVSQPLPGAPAPAPVPQARPPEQLQPGRPQVEQPQPGQPQPGQPQPGQPQPGYPQPGQPIQLIGKLVPAQPQPGPPPSPVPTNTAQQHGAHPAPQPQTGMNPSPPPPGMTRHSGVFRLGELVWYKHAAWRLGVILKFGQKPDPNLRGTEDGYQYLLAPLGLAVIGQQLRQQPVVKEAAAMRPFLTFSVPDTTTPELEGLTFSTCDWRSLLTPIFQDPDPAKRPRALDHLFIEASKMAARQVNASYSTFNPLPKPANAAGQEAFLSRYGGIFLGAEMICLGDPIRLAVPESPSSVMIVREIVLNHTSQEVSPSLTFVGNTYHLRLLQPDEAHVPVATPAELDPTCLEEAAFRNTLLRIEHENANSGTGGNPSNPPGSRWAWTPVERGAQRGEKDVQGRFYVTPRLMRIIDPGRAAANMQRGVLEDAQAYLNYRMQSAGPNYIGRRPTRMSVLAQAICAVLALPEGIVEGEYGG